MAQVTGLKKILARQWPQAMPGSQNQTGSAYATGVPALDKLFAEHGIPCGQLIEITGGTSSGKTSLLYMILAESTGRGTAAYIDLGQTFFPAAAEFHGVDLNLFLIARPDNSAFAVRTAEILLQYQKANCIVIDLVGAKHELPQTLIHRLRMQTVRSRALVIFLTESNSKIIPSSTVSLRLTVTRIAPARIGIEITKSRICREGLRTELKLYE